MMMPLSDMIRQDTPEILNSSITRLTVLTFVGAVLMNMVFIALFWENLKTSVIIGRASPDPAILQNILIYFVICFIYCFLSSISFTPKRMISPLHVQIASVGMIIIQLIIGFHHDQLVIQNSYTFFVNSFSAISVYAVMFIMIGWMIERGLKILIGISGTERDLVKRTFTINMKYKDVKQTLKNSDFRKDHEFRIIDNTDEKLVLKTRSYENIKIVLVCMPFEQDQTIISIVGHGLNYDSIINSRRARKRISSLERDINDELKDLESNVKPVDYEGNDSESYEEAKQIALKSTKIIFRNLPLRLIVTISVLISVGIWLIQPLNEQKITQDAYVAVWLAIITTIILLVVPTLREKKIEKD